MESTSAEAWGFPPEIWTSVARLPGAGPVVPGLLRSLGARLGRGQALLLRSGVWAPLGGVRVLSVF